ncbi:gamma carbonic anhydrase family protein [Ktedonosporobacter rubrisoli]|uniref:Gamma carbonic anhydrase family protein n=1 Tax=Ktedonosporobacter rubrisoli TaxID=2509675 RepID=A0A4P6JPK6_KTERU|nr:gamma carbonic anhydrase family protein [Ktedonosporobacter rubrisoli]QBD77319.1 gamma carbonic anhydrase family protein [Ktedonosporobacter rubrisoli]
MPLFPFQGIWPTLADNVFIAPGAMIIGNVILHEGASVWYNTVIRADLSPISIGRGTNIQDNCTLHVEANGPLSIGEECSIGHNAIVHAATIGNHVLVGMHAVVLSYAQISSDTLIGASALVSERATIPSGVLVLGIPARVVRPLTEADHRRILYGATAYATLAAEHRRMRKEGNT